MFSVLSHFSRAWCSKRNKRKTNPTWRWSNDILAWLYSVYYLERKKERKTEIWVKYHASRSYKQLINARKLYTVYIIMGHSLQTN
jgi:hypothetical protein